MHTVRGPLSRFPEVTRRLAASDAKKAVRCRRRLPVVFRKNSSLIGRSARGVILVPLLFGSESLLNDFDPIEPRRATAAVAKTIALKQTNRRSACRDLRTPGEKFDLMAAIFRWYIVSRVDFAGSVACSLSPRKLTPTTEAHPHPGSSPPPRKFYTDRGHKLL